MNEMTVEEMIKIMKKRKQKWHFFKRIFVVAEVDGITFYSNTTFKNYMIDKHRKINNLKLYTHRLVGEYEYAQALDILQANDVFDFNIECVERYTNMLIYELKYYAKRKIIKRLTVD